ncbi:hypothetical protein BDY19DRAFT_288825 [Irpex rosettiformis]|uniref:Uncharacterized protein n=1 Tax=Irpex rosettiformis TaxID=378272 RepID=A0ACB8UI25_9APHY|nr:hypothetical protein BDY19DRAFT_288825 [Irpex rosettiformis]
MVNIQKNRPFVPWPTNRHDYTVVTIILFAVLLTHYVCRAIVFGQARMINPPSSIVSRSTMPLSSIAATMSTIAGFISDGLLARGFYVVYGRRRWAFWLPTIAIIVNALLGLSGDFELLSYYTNPERYTLSLQVNAFRINAAWGWFTFTINTALTGAIVGRIICMSRYATRHNASRPYGGNRYNTVVAAVVESALVTWIGLLLYGISTLAPTGDVMTAWNIGFVMVCIVPIFFGISQCLITARLGFANDNFEGRESGRHDILGLPRSQASKRSAEEIAITVSKGTVDDIERDVIDIIGGERK